ncbi:hypothetical protein [Burkholderia phage FLC9]|nr:hypothetical protein [Burkholderia phage FLC9]
MLLNGKELTQQQIEQCIADHKLGGEKLTKKYKLDQGGEHPIVTKKAWEGARKRSGNPNSPNMQNYHQWCWLRLAMIAHSAEAQ